ncbi:hypothetical protein GCM10008956_26680 [Deinococcus arenae]|uniref:DUF4019 domain-containing protein n=1 Tax=Deinococcus arenae TaxID=1452751 RepID=A0A8H9GSB0_9DEIO|nr:hypothetical protein [Deinococcus arenae]AWT36835.1 hypothetical protein DM785_15730 [Deinococcus actinosclerus]GGM49271.1 hypothetical protein GCM10008956_26680 [Deinococcus arenae]
MNASIRDVCRTVGRGVGLSLCLLAAPPAAAQTRVAQTPGAQTRPAGPTTQAAAEQTALARGRALLAEFYAVKLDGLWQAFTPEVRAQWGTLADFRAYREAGVQTFGAQRQQVGERTLTRDGETFYVRSATFQRDPTTVWALVIGFTGPRVSTFVILREGETGNDPVAGLSPRWPGRL